MMFIKPTSIYTQNYFHRKIFYINTIIVFHRPCMVYKIFLFTFPLDIIPANLTRGVSKEKN